MIPAPKGLMAFYKHACGVTMAESVVAIADDGTALIAAGTQLLPAEEHLQGYISTDWNPYQIVSVIPGGGWMVTFTYEDVDDVEITAPVVAWGLNVAGDLMPMATDGSTSMVKPLNDQPDNVRWRVHHPELAKRPTGSRSSANRRKVAE